MPAGRCWCKHMVLQQKDNTVCLKMSWRSSRVNLRSAFLTAKCVIWRRRLSQIEPRHLLKRSFQKLPAAVQWLAAQLVWGQSQDCMSMFQVSSLAPLPFSTFLLQLMTFTVDVHNEVLAFRRCKEIITSWGPICVPFSMMGKRLQTADDSFGTHTAFFNNIAVSQDINIIENVTEYQLEILVHALPGFSLTPLKIDPRIFGLGAARTRLYVIAIRIGKLKWMDNFSLLEYFDALTSQVALNANDYYWMKLPASNLSPSAETCLHNDPFFSKFNGFFGFTSASCGSCGGK